MITMLDLIVHEFFFADIFSIVIQKLILTIDFHLNHILNKRG